jgi:transposase
LLAAIGLGRVSRVVCDRGYSSASWRAGIRLVGAEPVVPANRTHPSVAYDRAAYRRRHRVEQAWGRLKEWRAVATRYEKTAASYLGALHVAAALDWIKHGLT